MIKLMIALSTVLVGFFYTRNELKALVRCVTERDYVEWHELNRAVARREFQI